MAVVETPPAVRYHKARRHYSKHVVHSVGRLLHTVVYPVRSETTWVVRSLISHGSSGCVQGSALVSPHTAMANRGWPRKKAPSISIKAFQRGVETERLSSVEE